MTVLKIIPVEEIFYKGDYVLLLEEDFGYYNYILGLVVYKWGVKRYDKSNCGEREWENGLFGRYVMQLIEDIWIFVQEGVRVDQRSLSSLWMLKTFTV